MKLMICTLFVDLFHFPSWMNSPLTSAQAITEQGSQALTSVIENTINAQELFKQVFVIAQRPGL